MGPSDDVLQGTLQATMICQQREELASFVCALQLLYGG